MQYLDKVDKKLLCDKIDAQVRELDSYLIETLGWQANYLFSAYENVCIDAFCTDSIPEELSMRIEMNESSDESNLSKAISNYVDVSAMLWWAAGGIYEGKDEMGDMDSLDTPVQYLFSLMAQASTLNGIVKALADVACSKKSQSQKAARARWEDDPKSEEKAFVKECWLEWVADPSRYSSKANFLRDMHQKLESLTLNRSTLNDWIKNWSS